MTERGLCRRELLPDPLPTIEHGRFCYVVPADQDPGEHGGFVPSLVIEDEPGHWPMLGRGRGSAPWVWGATVDEAQRICRAYNARLGIDDRRAARIVASSMASGCVR